MAISHPSCDAFLSVTSTTNVFLSGKNHNRMSVISITDLDSSASLSALRSMRKQHQKSNDTSTALAEATSIVGGRLAFLSEVSRAQDMVECAKQMMRDEKEWLLSQIGLIKDCDDDVMDEQKSALCFLYRLLY
jgi:hypothetical protein